MAKAGDTIETVVILGGIGWVAYKAYSTGMIARFLGKSSAPQSAPGVPSATGNSAPTSGSSQVAPTPAPIGMATNDNGGNDPGYFIHQVIEGDTLTAIASRYGIGLGDLQFDNGIANPNVIYAGQVLRIRRPGTYQGAERGG